MSLNIIRDRTEAYVRLTARPAGVSLYEVMHLTGHKSVSMVQRYAHLAPDFQETAIAALEAFGTNRAQPEDGPAANVG